MDVSHLCRPAAESLGGACRALVRTGGVRYVAACARLPYVCLFITPSVSSDGVAAYGTMCPIRATGK